MPRPGRRYALLTAGKATSADVTVVPKLVKQSNGKSQGMMGFSPMPSSRPASFVEAATSSWAEFAAVFLGTLGALGGLVTHFTSTAGQLSGPIGIAQASAQVAEFGWGPYLALAATLSISLGIFNLLPIPALDGGRAAFILVEMLRGKPVDPEKEALVHVGGFAALIVIMLAVSYHDIANIVAGKAAL